MENGTDTAGRAPDGDAEVESLVMALLRAELLEPGPEEIPALIDAYRAARARVDLVRSVDVSRIRP